MAVLHGVKLKKRFLKKTKKLTDPHREHVKKPEFPDAPSVRPSVRPSVGPLAGPPHFLVVFCHFSFSIFGYFCAKSTTRESTNGGD